MLPTSLTYGEWNLTEKHVLDYIIWRRLRSRGTGDNHVFSVQMEICPQGLLAIARFGDPTHSVYVASQARWIPSEDGNYHPLWLAIDEEDLLALPGGMTHQPDFDLDDFELAQDYINELKGKQHE